MNDQFDLENYVTTSVEPQVEKIPKKWRGNYQYMYEALQCLTKQRKQTIKEEPSAYSDRLYTITTKDLCNALGKDKSYLNETRWKSKNTPIRKTMALLVKELNDVNEHLTAALKQQRSKKREIKQSKSQKKKSILVEENNSQQRAYNNLLKQGYEELIQQINFSGPELAARCEDLSAALKEERENNERLIQARKQQVKNQTRSLVEIQHLTKLNASLERELIELKCLVDHRPDVDK
jgi:hypothetical protein